MTTIVKHSTFSNNQENNPDNFSNRFDPLDSSNPLLALAKSSEALTDFQSLKPHFFTPALNTLLQDARTRIDEIALPQTSPTWESVVIAVERATALLGKIWSLLSHLSSVVDTSDLRSIYNENLTQITEFFSSISQNLKLYQHYQTLATLPEIKANSVRYKIVEDALQNFRLGGAELSADKKKQFASLQERQANLSKAFSDQSLDATHAFIYFVSDENELKGLPEDAREMAYQAAQQSNQSGWKFTLHFPSYFPILQYADSRSLREKFYRAYVTRASELGSQYAQGKLEWDTSQNICEQLALRHEESVLLGYQNYAEVSLATKMASSANEVLNFLNDLSQRARPSALKDWQTLQEFAQKKLKLSQLEPWDIAYAAEKLREQEYSFSDNEVRQYFPEASVINGLFSLVEKLFGISIEAEKASVWHSDVKFFKVINGGQTIAHFYLDLYAREGKQSGAWVNDAQSRCQLPNGQLQKPIAYVICNFSSPIYADDGTITKPALLDHDDVITLFHEFGHALHHMLTRVDELSVSGINGIEWDAIELPSQFMENFCWEWTVLETLSNHWQTNEKLPRHLFEKMLAAKNFQSGLGMLRQIVFSLFDMQLHNGFKCENEKSIIELAQTLHRQHHVLPVVSFSRWPNTFGHIFSGGYAAGYYSYKWAEVLSADAYALFEEEAAANGDGNVVNAETGRKFLNEILAVGGSRKAMDSFQAFRKRPPNIDAFLKHNAMGK